MQDTVKVASFGFIELGFRNGHIEVVNTGDIKSINNRGQGGTNLRLSDGRQLMSSVTISEVVAAIREADGRVHHAPA